MQLGGSYPQRYHFEAHLTSPPPSSTHREEAGARHATTEVRSSRHDDDPVLNSHILAYESLVGTLTKQVMAQQEQLTQLREALLCTNNNNTENDSKGERDVDVSSWRGDHSPPQRAPAGERSMRQSLQRHGVDSSGLVDSPSLHRDGGDQTTNGPRQLGHSDENPQRNSQRDDLPAAVHSAPNYCAQLEPIILEVLARYTMEIEERIALSIAERLRSATRKHVLATVDREVRHCMRDAMLNAVPPPWTLRNSRGTYPPRGRQSSSSSSCDRLSMERGPLQSGDASNNRRPHSSVVGASIMRDVQERAELVQAMGRQGGRRGSHSSSDGFSDRKHDLSNVSTTVTSLGEYRADKEGLLAEIARLRDQVVRLEGRVAGAPRDGGQQGSESTVGVRIATTTTTQQPTQRVSNVDIDVDDLLLRFHTSLKESRHREGRRAW